MPTAFFGSTFFSGEFFSDTATGTAEYLMFARRHGRR